MSPHILIDNDIDDVESATCPPLYEALALHNITAFMEASKITHEEFHHYCERLNRAIARRPGREA